MPYDPVDGHFIPEEPVSIPDAEPAPEVDLLLAGGVEVDEGQARQLDQAARQAALKAGAQGKRDVSKAIQDLVDRRLAEGATRTDIQAEAFDLVAQAGIRGDKRVIFDG